MSKPAPNRNEVSVAGFDAGAPGVTPPSSSSGRKGVFLTDVIVELGFADKERIDKAEDAARVSGKTVEQLLLDNGAIDENQLALAIAERNGLDHVDLEGFDVDMRAAESVGRSVAARCGAVPIAFSPDGALIVAVQDPLDSLAVRRIETTTGSEVHPAIAAVGAIKRVIERLPDEPPAPTPETEVPRLKSQRELQVEDSEEAEADVEAEAEAKVEEEEEETEVAAGAAVEEPAVEEPQIEVPPREEPEVERPVNEELRTAEPPPKPRDERRSSFDGLSMDLGPITMEPEPPEPAEAPGPEDDAKDDEQEGWLAQELSRARGKVAELEQRLREAVEAAEEATATSAKLRALRRVLEHKDDPS